MSDTLTYKPLRTSINGNDVLCEYSQNVYIPAHVESMKKISTLFVTDLPFTAKEAVKTDLPIIGYRGITDQYSDNLSTLDPDFAAFLSQKKIHTVVLLYNSDVVDPGFSHGSDEDLSKPLYNIYYAVKHFRDNLSDFDSNVTLCFAHIKHQFLFQKIVTLDDLYKEEDAAAVDVSLKKFKNKENSFFEKINITELSMNRLYTHLHLKDVITFYSYFSDKIKFSDFVYKSVRYAHDGDKLEKIQYTDASLYLRVGPDYYKRIMTLNSHDEYEEVLYNWKIGEIGRDYGGDFIKQIPRYDSFINRPCNTGEYQKTFTINHNNIVSHLFNIYHPVDHEPIAGEWPHIEFFLRHIFSACNLDGEVLFDFGLDYLQLTYLNPKQRLPTLCLVSSERNTGKSTFLDFLKLVFGANVAILDNQRFNPKFTSHFAGKLIVAIDEGHIPIHDKMAKEMIKNMATGKVMWLEAKGSNAKSVENFTHLIFCSNDENNFMQIDAGENRFAVLKVPSFRKAGQPDDPDLIEKMRIEIPAFLNHLQNRKLASSEKITRFWFSESVYTTEALQVVMDRTKSTIENELDEFFTDAFLNFKQFELHYTIKDLHQALNENADFKLPKAKLSDLLNDKYGITPGASKRYTLFTADADGETAEHKRKGRYCTFYAKDWLSKENFNELSKIEESDNF